MITIFTTTKPFIGKNLTIQINALKSWKLLKPECDIIVFGDSQGTNSVAHNLNLIHIPHILCNESGTPLLNDLFYQAKSLSNYDVLCYVNADIILMSDFIEAINPIIKKEKHFMIVGQRWDVDIDDPLEFSQFWEKNIKRMVTDNGKLHSRTGIDYFVFNKKLFDNNIPPFAIGRTAWDNWLLFAAKKSGAKLIDASSSIMCIHQNHDWSHIEGGKNEAWEGTEAKLNQKMAAGKMLFLNDANYFLTPQGLKRNIVKRIFVKFLNQKLIKRLLNIVNIRIKKIRFMKRYQIKLENFLISLE